MQPQPVSHPSAMLAAWRSPRVRLGLAVAGALLLNLVPTLLQDVIPNYDRQTHLFMADHYLHRWFDAWEPRWFGGFCMFSYPPLAHQLVALLGAVVGLEAAYGCIQLATLVALPWAIHALAEELVAPEAAGLSALLAALASGTALVTFAFGMLPTVLAFTLAVAATAALLRYLRLGSRPWLLAWSALGAATMATHHLTCILCLPLLALAAVGAHATRSGRRDAMRIVMAAACLLLAGTLVILPFWWWVLTLNRPQAEIPHYTRSTIWSSGDLAWRYFMGLGGGALLIAPFALWTAVRDRRLWALAAVIATFGVLGLGGTTPLPRLLFPGWWKWLTYDRFAYWAFLLVLVPGGVWLDRCRPRLQAPVLLAFLVLAALAATTTVRAFTQPLPLDGDVMRGVHDFLGREGRDRYYYATIGLAESELAHLSRLTSACTLDGLYYTARRDAFQRESGHGPQDTVLPWVRPDGRSYMKDVLLPHPHAFGLRYVISASRRGNEVLQADGWKPVAQFGPDGGDYEERVDLHSCQVVVWEAPDPARIRPIHEMATVEPSPRLLEWLWGGLPLLSLAVGLGALAWTSRPSLRAADPPEAPRPEAARE